MGREGGKAGRLPGHGYLQCPDNDLRMHLHHGTSCLAVQSRGEAAHFRNPWHAVPAADPPSTADPSFCCSPCAVTWREGRFHNPWDTWQERSFSDVLKWNRERRK